MGVATGVLAFGLAAAGSAVQAEGLRISYLYNLSDFSGKVPYNHVHLFADPLQDEVYVADGESVRIFNGSGMETYRFGDGQGVSGALDFSVDAEGDILALAYDSEAPADEPRFRILRSDYRGEPKSAIEISGLPPEFAGILPNGMLQREGRFWLLSRTQLLAVEVNASGGFERGIDLAKPLEIPEEKRADHEVFGFALDPAGNLLLTIPVLFKVFVVSPEGRLVAQFGKPGSGKGLFGVVAAVAADAEGNLYVADRLRSVVIVFDSSYRLVAEFGYFGPKPENLVRPGQLAVGAGGKLYVTQLRKRGVAVFSVAPEAQGN